MTNVNFANKINKRENTMGNKFKNAANNDAAKAQAALQAALRSVAADSGLSITFVEKAAKGQKTPSAEQRHALATAARKHNVRFDGNRMVLANV